jgi:hypothetical protein
MATGLADRAFSRSPLVALILLALPACHGGSPFVTDLGVTGDHVGDGPTTPPPDRTADAHDGGAPGLDLPATDAETGDSGGGGDAADLTSDGGTPPDGLDGGAVFLDALLLYTLDAAAFPESGQPSVAVHVPPGFQPSAAPGLVVFFHGFNNCVANVVGRADGPCVDGGGARSALHLSDQLDTAGVNAILVAVQLAYDQATGDPGNLAQPDVFRDMLHELLTQHLDPLLGAPLDVADFDPFVLASHSGGYEALAQVLQVGGVPEVNAIQLYDSLYGELTAYGDWFMQNVDRFDPSRTDGTRFSNAYLYQGTTYTNSRDFESEVAGWLSQAGLSSSLFDDDTTDTLTQDQFAPPVIFKASMLAHTEIPQYYFQRFVQAAGFTPLGR